MDVSFLVDIGANFFTAFYDEAKLDFVWERQVLMQAVIYTYTPEAGIENACGNAIHAIIKISLRVCLKEIALKYLKWWFWIDLFSSLPIDTFFDLNGIKNALNVHALATHSDALICDGSKIVLLSWTYSWTTANLIVENIHTISHH